MANLHIHAFNLYGRILDRPLHEEVDFDKMQYGFVPRRGTFDVVIVLRRLDGVPRKFLCFALRQKYAA